MLGWEVFSWGEGEKKLGMERRPGVGVGLPEMLAEQFFPFWSGHEFLAFRRACCLGQSAALLCPSLQHTLCAVTPVAQPSFYRFQSPNISYGPGEPEPESDLSRPGTELASDTTRGLAGNSVPRFYIENLGHQQILLLGPNTHSCGHHD